MRGKYLDLVHDRSFHYLPICPQASPTRPTTMELIHTLGIAIDPSAAKSGSAQAAAAFQQVGVAARASGAAAQVATKALGPYGVALGVVKKAVSAIDFEGMITGLYETSTSLDKLQRQLKSASSGSDDFRENFGFLRGVAKELGLEFVSTGEAFAKFATAAKGKLSGSQIRDTFLAAAEASVAMGQGIEQTSERLKTLGEMIEKGATAEELGKLAKAQHEAFGSGAAEGAKSLQAEMNRLKNTWMEIQAFIMGEGGDSIFGKALKFAREALEEFKDWLAALFEANEEGELSEAIAAAFQFGLGQAINYFGGFVRTAAQMLGVLASRLLNPETFFLLTEQFAAVAMAFGLALLEAVKKPLAYVQAIFELSRDVLTNPKQAIAGGSLTARVKYIEDNDPLANTKNGIKKGLEFISGRIAKQSADAFNELAAVGVDFHKLDLIDTSSYSARKNLFAGRTKNPWAAPPPAPGFSGKTPSPRSTTPLANLPTFSAPGSLIPSPLILSREPLTPPETAPEAAPSLFTRFRQGLQAGTQGFTDAAQQMLMAGEDTARALTGDFSEFFTSAIEGTKSLGAAFRDMASSILRDIERILIHRLIAEPIVGAITGALGLPTTKSHHGGLVGTTGGMSTLVNPLLFLGAPRLHHGLAPDEFPAILQRGERVVPKSQAGAWDRGAGAININVSVDGSKGGTPAQNKAFGAEVARQIEAMVDARIARAAMPRGILRPAAAYA